ncbi:hypothetical protein B0J12DRAFT_413235 [Macrophomina phaseolina]|uniref:Uncharacterized protein n=1 Tax=Macrophomina phaseolina TaxID=35725 RepID=A0ABQ8GJG3_9PEZI|nr:hypothetical protein B0J12DRAFT_413235 [Macrophomina phaseolina]
MTPTSAPIDLPHRSEQSLPHAPTKHPLERSRYPLPLTLSSPASVPFLQSFDRSACPQSQQQPRPSARLQARHTIDAPFHAPARRRPSKKAGPPPNPAHSPFNQYTPCGTVAPPARALVREGPGKHSPQKQNRRLERESRGTPPSPGQGDACPAPNQRAYHFPTRINRPPPLPPGTGTGTVGGTVLRAERFVFSDPLFFFFFFFFNNRLRSSGVGIATPAKKECYWSLGFGRFPFFLD